MLRLNRKRIAPVVGLATGLMLLNPWGGLSSAATRPDFVVTSVGNPPAKVHCRETRSSYRGYRGEPGLGAANATASVTQISTKFYLVAGTYEEEPEVRGPDGRPAVRGRRPPRPGPGQLTIGAGLLRYVAGTYDLAGVRGRRRRHRRDRGPRATTGRPGRVDHRPERAGSDRELDLQSSVGPRLRDSRSR